MTSSAALGAHESRRPRGRSGLYGWVVEQVGQSLVDGRTQAGASLAPDVLEDQYGVSRSVAREALRALEAKGMIAARQSVGTVATDQREWNVLDPDVVRWRVHSAGIAEQMRDLLGLRVAIETYAAGRAANVADKDQKDVLKELVRELRATYEADDIDSFARVDVRLHSAIVTSAGNAMVTQLLDVITQAFDARRELLWPDHLSADVVDRHVRLVESIVAGEATEARMQARSLIEEVSDAVDTALDRTQRRPRARR